VTGDGRGAKASAINAFLLDALGAADPWSKGSRNVSLLEALRLASGKAQTSFADSPSSRLGAADDRDHVLEPRGVPEAEKALQTSLDLRVRPRAEERRRCGIAGALSRCTPSAEVRRGGKRAARRSRSRAESTARRARRRPPGRTTFPTRSSVSGSPPRRSARRGDPPDRAGVGADRTPVSAKAETDALLILIQVATAEEDYKNLAALTRERLDLLKKRLGTGTRRSPRH